jgi:hypothetical protein
LGPNDNGNYWGSTIYDTTTVYSLIFTQSYVRPGTTIYSKSNDIALRCVINNSS